MAKQSGAIDLAKLLENTKLPLSDLLNAVQSLSRRCFIEQPGKFYTISPVLRQYAAIRFGD
ncbi:MAG: hypothetical protein MUE44_33690 [Oscillatoriaceae cyanobacterium Prado104]|nr:hypothetical protein [Oscillatoriaceae cyanobacterium Prado104]